MVPQKASGGVGGGVGGGGGGVVYHTSTGQYIGVATFFFFFFFFFESGLKLDEKSIENGLEGQKFLVVCLFWGGATTLIETTTFSLRKLDLHVSKLHNVQI